MGLRTVDEYRDSLKDGREVYCLGEKIDDVTTDPYLKICTDWCAAYYVLAQDSRFRDLFIARDDDGEDVSFNFMPIRRKEDLLRRREIVRALARMCFGKPSGAQFTGIDGSTQLRWSVKGWTRLSAQTTPKMSQLSGSICRKTI